MDDELGLVLHQGCSLWSLHAWLAGRQVSAVVPRTMVTGEN